ncbi:MAG: hypothetical protein WDM91_07770 [Rhizomicrobium sp.]
MGARLLSCAAAAAFLAMAWGPAAAQSDAPCLAIEKWFPHPKTRPPNSKGFPSAPNNCDFHQWSWNAFLWLTQDVKGQPRFETMPADGVETPAGVLNPLIGRAAKATELNLVQQAGPDGIMVDLQGHPIYYSIHSDKTFGAFVKTNGLLDPAKLRAFDPNTSFPVDTLTLKAAWKVVEAGEDTSGFYTRRAKIALLATKNGQIVVTNKTKTVKVALIGFHVAGTVNGHPEMIWATFEQMQNAPDLPKAVDQMAPNDIVSDKSWTFYTANTPFKTCNVNSAGAGALKLDAAAQTLSPVTQVCRIIPYGGGAASNIANIKTLNDSVHKTLTGVWNNYFEVGAIWFNRADALKPDCTFQPGALQCSTTPILTGSTQLSNATVETFTQAQSAQNNCFACHNTVQVTSPNTTMPSLPGKNVDISHVLIDAYFNPTPKTKPKPKARAKP